jgi:hypothetical protein
MCIVTGIKQYVNYPQIIDPKVSHFEPPKITPPNDPNTTPTTDQREDQRLPIFH